MGRNKMEKINDSGWRQLEVLKEKYDFNTTKELATLFRVQAATIIRSLCVHGNYLGLKPLKLQNNRLLWPRIEAEKLLKK